MTVKIGDPAIYLPRVPYGRQSELFCFVTRIIDAERGIVDLVAFPAGGEIQNINNVAPKSDQIQIHCWEPKVDSRIAELEERLSAIEVIANTRITVNEQLSQQIAQEELSEAIAKRGPGRPRKADAA